MKWFSGLQNIPQKSPDKRISKKMTLWLTRLFLCPLIGSLVLSGDVGNWRSRSASLEAKSSKIAVTSSELLANKVRQIAEETTVKVYTQNSFLGSGIIWHRQEQEYLVLTNQHVLRAGKFPFKVQTPDGEIYRGRVITLSNSVSDDLALISFKSDRHRYQTAVIGNSDRLETGQPIFAAGFPAPTTEKLPPISHKSGLEIATGKITTVLPKPLQEGYQIAYDNEVQKGMSGGPLLNQQGELVGINGKHAYPLWEAPDFYEDNSQPCEPLQKLIARSSLAIPIEKAIALTLQTDWAIAQSSESAYLSQNKPFFSTIVNRDESQSSSQLVTPGNNPDSLCH